MAEALKLSFMIGISPDVFWSITPWQFKICCEAWREKTIARHDRESFLMWHNAILPKMKNIPPLDKFMIKKAVQGVDESAIIERLKMYQAQRDSQKCQS